MVVANAEVVVAKVEVAVARAEVVVAKAEADVAKTEAAVTQAEVVVARRDKRISELRDGVGWTNIGEERTAGNRWAEDSNSAIPVS